MTTTFLVPWLSAQFLCLLGLWIGSKLANHRWMMILGRVAHDRKMTALERFWPLTQIRPAVEKGDQRKCATILSMLIVAKSLLCFLLGIVVIFWLPLACLIVPSIIAVHDPDDRQLKSWIMRVSILQVTSHTLAAALGFAIVVEAMYTPEPLLRVIESQAVWIIVVITVSLGFALAAGRTEASGLMKRGI